MADSNLVTQEEMALRRRARRRLVGAVAIALTAVLVLPMVFDPEPKPLGPEVDLNIPAKDSPFEPAPPAASVQVPAVEPALRSAEPTQPGAAQNPAALPRTEPTPATPVPPADKRPSEDGKSMPLAEREAAQPVKPGAKAEMGGQAAKPVPPRQETKPPAKADPAFASKGFFLQLGAFSSEINARQLQAKAEAAGFKAGLTGANGQFRVRVGPIAEHDKALEMQARLKARGFAPVLLGP